jgi:hypothetical protein
VPWELRYDWARIQFAQNCRNCRAINDLAFCPCGCGSYAPIDRKYTGSGKTPAIVRNGKMYKGQQPSPEYDDDFSSENR